MLAICMQCLVTKNPNLKEKNVVFFLLFFFGGGGGGARRGGVDGWTEEQSQTKTLHGHSCKSKIYFRQEARKLSRSPLT